MVQDLLSCNLCEYDKEMQSEMDSHVSWIHGGNLSSSNETVIEEQHVDEIASEEGEVLMAESIAMCGICAKRFTLNNPTSSAK